MSVAARLNISPLQQSALTKAVIEEARGDPRHAAKSYSTADKARRSTAKVITKNVEKNWIPPTAATLPWDNKQVQTLANKNVKEEKLPVLVGIATDIKLLGVAKYNTGKDLASGEIIAKNGSAKSPLSAYALSRLLQILDMLHLLVLQLSTN